MGMFKKRLDEEEEPIVEDEGFDLSLPGREPQPADRSEAVEEPIRADDSLVGTTRFDDEEDEDHDFDHEDDLGEPEDYVHLRNRGRDSRAASHQTSHRVAKEGFHFGLGAKVFAAAAGAICVLFLMVALFGGGGSETQSGPSDADLAAANQASVEKKAKALMEQRLAIRRKKIAELRAARKARAAAKAAKAREAELARAREKAAKAAEKETTSVGPTTVSSPEPTYTPPATTYYTPPAPAPEAPAPEPVSAPAESQAEVNQSTASTSFGIGG